MSNAANPTTPEPADQIERFRAKRQAAAIEERDAWLLTLQLLLKRRPPPTSNEIDIAMARLNAAHVREQAERPYER